MSERKDEDNERDPDETLNMDGSWHRVPGRRTCVCASFGKDCPACGGFMHYQPVYGGFYYQCEDCGKELN